MPDSWRSGYEKRIRSAQWKNMKRDIAKLRGGKCERCGTGGKLELHHKTYERLGREAPTDLELLCGACHKNADRERAKAGQIRSANAWYAAAFDTYICKKYGQDYMLRSIADEHALSEEFDEWLEKQNDDEWRG